MEILCMIICTIGFLQVLVGIVRCLDKGKDWFGIAIAGLGTLAIIGVLVCILPT